MSGSSQQHEPIPRHFQNVAEAADFWDGRDLTDYWDLNREVDFAVDIQRCPLSDRVRAGIGKEADSLCPSAEGLDRDAYQHVVN